jgi:hypothetical protein
MTYTGSTTNGTTTITNYDTYRPYQTLVPPYFRRSTGCDTKWYGQSRTTSLKPQVRGSYQAYLLTEGSLGGTTPVRGGRGTPIRGGAA